MIAVGVGQQHYGLTGDSFRAAHGAQALASRRLDIDPFRSNFEVHRNVGAHLGPKWPESGLFGKHCHVGIDQSPAM